MWFCIFLCFVFYYFTWKYSGFLPRLIRNYLIDECWIQNCKMQCIVIRNILNTNSRCVYDLSNLILGTTENYEINIGTKGSPYTIWMCFPNEKFDIWFLADFLYLIWLFTDSLCWLCLPLEYFGEESNWDIMYICIYSKESEKLELV